jgi:hypothetical protein
MRLGSKMEGSMGEITRGERMQIMLTAEEVAALDDWRFAKRMPSRAAAIRELLKRGLAAEGFEAADASVQSKQFGVVDGEQSERKAGKIDGSARGE